MSSPSNSSGNDAAIDEYAQYWVARLVARNVSETELDAFEAWLAANPRHARAFARERALWQDLGMVADALTKPPSEQFIIATPTSITFMRRPLVRAASVALASLIVALFAPSLLLALRADHRTSAGEVRSVALPDGTTAMLDSHSAISVAFDGDRRIVHLLAGRAWFDVHHEARPFLVEALDGRTQDIGTGFDVRMDGDAIEVGVTEGTVRVYAPGSRRGPALHAGDRARYTADSLQMLKHRSAADLASWRKGELLFDRRPVTAAISEIARYRRAPVWAVGDFSKTLAISGLFLIERPDEALETIARMRGLRMITLPGGAVIVRPSPVP